MNARRVGGAVETGGEPAVRTRLDGAMLRRLWGYVRPHRALVGSSLAVLFTVSAVQLVQPYLVKWAIDGPIREGRLRDLGGVAGLYFVVLLAEFGLRFAQLYLLERTGQNVVLALRMHVFSHLQALSSSFFDRTPVGRLMTRVTSDVESLNEAFTSGLVLILADVVKLAGIVAVLLWMDWRLALVTFAVVPPLLLLTRFFQVRIRKAYQEVRRMVAQLNAFLQENVVGVRLVQWFRRERKNIEEFDELNRTHRDADFASVKYDSMFSAFTELMSSVTLAAILWAGAWRILGDAMTFGTLVAFIQYANRFFQPVQELSQRYAIMQAAMAASERIFDLLDTPPAIVPRDDAVRPAGRVRGEVVFDRVTFGYDPEQPVLHDVSFRIAPGERVAVVGWTGSGKSTIVRLLIRLYDVQQGRILVDGIDVRDWDPAALRRAVGVVLQDPFLFAGSVESNVTLGDPAVTAERAREAAVAVRADRFIETLPGGWNEDIRERGSNLSVGEKQLLSFARALAFDPAILVLDEATSSVDAATESDIRRALERVLRDRTSIVIAHRLATVRDSDRILVLHHGRVREEGPHDRLVRLEGGIYRTLYSLQAAE